MESLLPKIQALVKKAEPFRWQIAGGAVLFFLLSLALLWFSITGGLRANGSVPPPTATSTEPAAAVLPRRLDGVFVPAGQEAYPPRAVMVENHPDARPVSGLSRASLVIEAPVEGGITRFLAFFDATTTLAEVGPVRSARPYYVDWAEGWRASYFHVGGSPEALDKIRSLTKFTDVNEYFAGNSFWRDDRRYAPHNVYTDKARMDEIVSRKTASGTTSVAAWHFQDVASSTDRGAITSIKISYGGSFNVAWAYDAERGTYVRRSAGLLQKDRDGSAVEAENIIVIKTEQQVLDAVGRLRVRTTGNGEAMAYRDGKKFILRWRRSAGEPMRFESSDGTEFIFTRGRTWIEVTTDDATFAGLGG